MSPIRLLLSLACLAGVFVAFNATAAPPRVNDEGKFFSAGAVGKEDQIIKDIFDRCKRYVLVDTSSEILATCKSSSMKRRSGARSRCAMATVLPTR
jgi:hypothetical protein